MSDYFPEEIIQKILLRLPIKSIIKFTAVCKSWMSLIKSSTFIQSHLRCTINYNDKNDAHLLLLSASSCNINDNILHQHHRLHWDSPEFGEHSKVLLMTFCIRLKLVCITMIMRRNSQHMTIYDHVYDNFIASFNLATEVFGEIMIPEALQKDISSISRYGDSLALINYDCDSRDMVNYGCDIWVMKDYGVAESWTFLYNIGMFEVTIYGFKRCGKVMIKETDLHGESRMVSLDPKSKQVKDLGTKDCIYHYMDSFVESLVLLDHANAISYQGEINIVSSVLSMATYVDCKSERARVLVQNFQ